MEPKPGYLSSARTVSVSNWVRQITPRIDSSAENFKIGCGR